MPVLPPSPLACCSHENGIGPFMNSLERCLAPSGGGLLSDAVMCEMVDATTREESRTGWIF